MGKQNGKRAKKSAKPRDLGRVETGRAAGIKGGCQNNTVIFAVSRP
jgi:hypothetical protein